MIPITSGPTPLCKEKAAKLFKHLINLKSTKPDEEFVKEMDDFLHDSLTYMDEDNWRWASSNKYKCYFRTVKLVVETYPELLATTDEKGYLPIHVAACQRPEFIRSHVG